MTDPARFSIVQNGDDNYAVQANGPIIGLDDPADRKAMAEFIAAATQSLATLELSSAARAEADRAIAALNALDSAADDAPTRARRRELATTLRSVLEEVAGNVVGGLLLGIWHP